MDTKNLFDDLRPVDLIAIITIIGGMGLLYAGKNSTISAMLLGIIAFYFGMKTPNGRNLK